MIIGRSHNTALRVLKQTSGLFRGTRKKDNSKQTEALLSALGKDDPGRADALKKKLEESQSVIEQLKAAKQDIIEQRKAAAAQKVARIKEELKALRLLVSVNPEAAAKKAKQLARELKQAVQDYTAGGGVGTMAMQTTGSQEASVTDIGNEKTMVEATVQSNLTTSDNVEAVPVSGTKSFGKADGTKIEDTPQTANAEFREYIQEQLSTSNEDFTDSKKDRDFINEVKKVKAILKSIIELIKKKLKQKDDFTASQDIKDVERSLSDVGKILDDFSSGGVNGTHGAVNILA